MRQTRTFVVMGIGFLLTGVSAGWTQEIIPRVGYAFPAGGRQGESVQVTLGGKYLDRIHTIHISGSGVEAKLVKEIEPLQSEEAGALRKRLTELSRLPRDERNADTRLEAAGLERKLALYLGETARRRAQPALSEAVAIEVVIAADAEPGQRELRVESSRGISNPIRFCVGQLPEFIEDQAGLVPEALDQPSVYRFPPKVTTDITIPAVVNGQVIPREPDYVHWEAKRFTPGDADRFRFAAQQGQRLVVAVSARALIPYLADAVPGWFQATLTLFDDAGNEIAYHDDYHFHPDPVLLFEVPKDGHYVMEIKDAIFRGRPDFIYRISVGELPFIRSIFPLGGPTGSEINAQLTGWNLPADSLTVNTRDNTVGVRQLTVHGDGVTSNSVLFDVDTLPELRESEPNDKPSQAKSIKLPVIVNGRVDRTGDWDLFRIEGHRGDSVVAEVRARRLGSPLDSVLELIDAAGGRVAFNDDHEDKSAALITHHADSLIHTTLPADGIYYLRLGSAQDEGGQEFAYRLRVSAPRPDFELRVSPSGVTAVSWRLRPITVFALRKDGFDGPIRLSFRDAPHGVLMDGGVVPAGQESVRVTLMLARWLPDEPLRVCLEGRATIDGREVVRAATPADNMMQAFAYKHLVPANDLSLVLTGAGNRPKPPADPTTFRSMWTLLGDQPISISAGGEAEVQARAPWTTDRGPIEFELSEPPAGLVIKQAACEDRIVKIVLHAQADSIQVGLKGNLIVNGYQRRTQKTNSGGTREFRSLLGPLPAIPFEIVEQSSEGRLQGG